MWDVYLGLSSGGALLKLTTGIWRVAGRVWSDGGRKGRGGRRGDRSGELRPRVRRRGDRWALDTEFCSSSFSSSSRIAGSFFTRPPLLSQSSWERPSRISYIDVYMKCCRYTCFWPTEVNLSRMFRPNGILNCMFHSDYFLFLSTIFCKGTLNRSKVTLKNFIMLQNISILNKCKSAY